MGEGAVGVFGGSFDPPHVGHVALVRAALDGGFVSRVLVVPVFAHALHKQSSPFSLRIELARLAFADVPGVEVSDLEASLPVPSYTLQTLEALARLHAGSAFRLLAGADIAGELPRWHRVEEVLARAPLLLFARRGMPTPEGAIVADIPEVSSRELRRLLERRSDPALGRRLAPLVPPRVLERIEADGLYLGVEG